VIIATAKKQISKIKSRVRWARHTTHGVQKCIQNFSRKTWKDEATQKT